MKVPNFKENKGISLASLVVTVIVILILAAISLYMMTGDNNLIFRTGKAKEESERAEIEEALNASLAILTKNRPDDKTRILMAFYKNEPSSILIGNALKVDKKGHLHYSSRKNHSKNETELDWLATWNKKIPGEGQATVYEYFFTLLNDGFKQCFVRSEIPENLQQ